VRGGDAKGVGRGRDWGVTDFFQIHSFHRALHPTHHLPHTPRHLPHRNGRLHAAGDGIDAGA